ncbi:hypothetical protein [Treponema lecithinolyticum]
MYTYAYFITRAEKCTRLAKTTADENLKQFYLNAAEGFKLKAGNLTIAEAQTAVVGKI